MFGGQILTVFKMLVIFGQTTPPKQKKPAAPGIQTSFFNLYLIFLFRSIKIMTKTETVDRAIKQISNANEDIQREVNKGKNL